MAGLSYAMANIVSPVDSTPRRAGAELSLQCN
jgi:hypothetical protein